jgi:adiponectin receptor
MLPEYRKYRAIMFMAAGAMGVFPIFHMMCGIENPPWFIVPDLIVVFSSYFVGAVIFATRVPERWLPGWVDYFCASHQLFHMFVNIGAISTYVMVHKLFEWRQLAVCPV